MAKDREHIARDKQKVEERRAELRKFVHSQLELLQVAELEITQGHWDEVIELIDDVVEDARRAADVGEKLTSLCSALKEEGD